MRVITLHPSDQVTISPFSDPESNNNNVTSFWLSYHTASFWPGQLSAVFTLSQIVIMLLSLDPEAYHISYELGSCIIFFKSGIYFTFSDPD